MDQENSCSLQGTEAIRTISPRQAADTEDIDSRYNNPRPAFNRHLYLNLLCNIESQIESWNRSAVRHPDPEAAHALWLKAEGLGYALRLLYAFEPEFRELVECASRGTGLNPAVSTAEEPERKSL